MKSFRRLVAAFLFFCVAPLGAIEIATGAMLGPRYDAHSFYFRAPGDSRWRKTYSDKGYRRQARGKLMNIRLAQALFHDEWMSEHPFDPEANTQRVIEALDFYKRHGVLMINVSLQGGNPGYSKEVNGIARQNGAKYGREGGLLVSAFASDGSLKPAWLNRLERLLRAADERGMFVCVMYFYQGQDEIFDSPDAIEAAARNITDWLIEKKFRNVIIDVANEWDLQGDTWDQGDYIPQNIAGLVERVRERFQKMRADFLLPIGASTGGRMIYPASLAQVCDIVLLHGNGRTPAEKLDKVQLYKDYEIPVLMTEDDNGRETVRPHYMNDVASCDALFRYGAGWGYMPWVQAQRFPFEYMPGPSPEFTDDMPVPERDQAYFHAVLDHMARLVLEKPPEGGKWKK